MRISGGSARGTILAVPKGGAVRPATDGMRQAVFSSLGARIVGARFLDLFAGSGGYGLEAWSRGARGGVFVEQNAKAAACLRQNILTVAKSAARSTLEVQLVQGDALTWRPEVGPKNDASPEENGPTNQFGETRPDLVFIDPPYPLIMELAPRLFASLNESTSGGDEPLVVFEYPGEITLQPLGWELIKRIGRGVRQPTVGFFRRA